MRRQSPRVAHMNNMNIKLSLDACNVDAYLVRLSTIYTISNITRFAQHNASLAGAFVSVPLRGYVCVCVHTSEKR